MREGVAIRLGHLTSRILNRCGVGRRRLVGEYVQLGCRNVVECGRIRLEILRQNLLWDVRGPVGELGRWNVSVITEN